MSESLTAEMERLKLELTVMTESRRLACLAWDAALAEVERLQAMNVKFIERAAALVEAHESDDGSNLCEMLAAKIRAMLPSQ